MNTAEMFRGRWIVFDGPDGCGKSTLAKALADHITGQVDVVQVREPGGTVWGERVRELVLSKDTDEKLSPEAACLMMGAAHLQLVNVRIIPAIQAGKCVIADRGCLSGYVYQGALDGVSLSLIDSIYVADHVLQPVFVVLDTSWDIASARMHKRPTEDNRFDRGQSHWEAVNRAYQLLAGRVDNMWYASAAYYGALFLRIRVRAEDSPKALLGQFLEWAERNTVEGTWPSCYEHEKPTTPQ